MYRHPSRRGLVALATAFSLSLAVVPHVAPAHAGRADKVLSIRGNRTVGGAPAPSSVRGSGAVHPAPRLGRAFAAARAEKARLDGRPPTMMHRVRALAVAFATDGPRHTWTSIKKNPVVFVAGAVAIGGIGAISSAFGVPMVGMVSALAISTIGLGVQIKTALPRVLAARGMTRWRRIGADIVWPVFLYAGTFGLAHVGAQLLGLDHGGMTHGPSSPPGPAGIAIAGVESAVIGSDAPAIGVTALESLRGSPTTARATQRKPRGPVAWIRGSRARSRARRRRRMRRRARA